MASPSCCRGGRLGGDASPLSWLDGVNTNAYYFVDVVTTNGLAPIYFTVDRDLCLGNPQRGGYEHRAQRGLRPA